MLVFNNNNNNKKDEDSSQFLSRLKVVRRPVPSSKKKITVANKKFLLSLGLQLNKNERNFKN